MNVKFQHPGNTTDDNHKNGIANYNVIIGTRKILKILKK